MLANEFFHPDISRMGGFGWAARQVAACFASDPSLGVDVSFVSCDPDTSGAAPLPAELHGVRLVRRRRGRFRLLDALRARLHGFDLPLTIDYRPSYRGYLHALPHTPVIVWVRDPRPPEDCAEIASLRIPGSNGAKPCGIEPADCRSLGRILRRSRLRGRGMRLATPAPHLGTKIPATYGTGPLPVAFLPNIVDVEPGGIPKSPRPRVLFLGRLDPIKRPWLFYELARALPDVEFLLLGQAHFEGDGAWRAPQPGPPNLRALGHVDGQAKLEALASSWVLVNTSIHESLAVSFLEALRCATPLLALQDPGGCVSRFGIAVTQRAGTGADGLPELRQGLARLLGDPPLRQRLGREGQRWVQETHSRARFVAAFDELRARLGVGRQGEGYFLRSR